MIKINIFFLISLVSFVACGDGPDSPIFDGLIEKCLDDDDSAASLTLAGGPSASLIEDSLDESYADASVSELCSYDDSLEDLLNDEFSSAPVSLVGESSETLNEDKPTGEDKADEVSDTALHSVELETPAISTEQQSGRPTYVSGSGLESKTYSSIGTNCVQHVSTRDHAVIDFADMDENHNTLNDLTIVFKGETLLIGGHKMQEVDATLRPLVLTWGNNKLFVNGIEQPALEGIEGRGTWYF